MGDVWDFYGVAGRNYKKGKEKKEEKKKKRGGGRKGRERGEEGGEDWICLAFVIVLLF